MLLIYTLHLPARYFLLVFRFITDQVHSLLLIILARTGPLRTQPFPPNHKLLYAKRRNQNFPEDSFDVEVGIYRIIHLTLLSEPVSNGNVLPETRKKRPELVGIESMNAF